MQSVITNLVSSVMLLVLVAVDHTLALWWLVGSVVLGQVWLAVIVGSNNKALLDLLKRIERD